MPRNIFREDQWWLSTSKAKEALARDVPGVPLNNSPVRHWLQRIFAPSYGKFCAFLRFYWAAKLGYSGSEKAVVDYVSCSPDVKIPRTCHLAQASNSLHLLLYVNFEQLVDQGEGQVSEHVARRRFREHTSYVKARMASAYDASHLLLGFERDLFG